MYKKFLKTSILAAALSFIYACSPDEQVAPIVDKSTQTSDVVACEVITFEHAVTRNASGFVTSVASSGGAIVAVQGFRRDANGTTYGTTSYANLFNTTGTTPVAGSDDTDLMMAETGNVLIANGTSNASVPDDFAGGSRLILNFAAVGSVTLSSFDILDNEEGAVVRLYNAANALVGTINVPPGVDGGVQTVNLGNIPGVVRMEVTFGTNNVGSAAIDNIRFCRQVERPCDIITFEQAVTRNASGFVTSVQSLYGATIGVQGFRRDANGTTYGTTSYANLFNTTGTTPVAGSDDTDLMMAETGNVLIANGTSNASVPDDFAGGSKVALDFSSLGTVTATSLQILDNEEQNTKIYLYGIGGVLLSTINVPQGVDGGVQTVSLGNTAGVVRIEVAFGSGNVGSAAIDNVVFCPEPPRNGCVRTQGYWKNHASNSKHYDRTWGQLEGTKFFKSNYTYYSILNVQPRGNAYYILAHQYVATTLNLKVASAPASVLTAYAQATALFNTYTPEQVAASKTLEAQATYLAGILDAYNNGKLGPTHCAD